MNKTKNPKFKQTIFSAFVRTLKARYDRVDVIGESIDSYEIRFVQKGKQKIEVIQKNRIMKMQKYTD